MRVSRSEVPDLTRSSQSVRLERNDDVRYENIKLLDLRFARPFQWNNVRFEPFVDLYNIFNANTVLRQTTTFGSRLGRVSEIINPRIIKIGAKFDF